MICWILLAASHPAPALLPDDLNLAGQCRSGPDLMHRSALHILSLRLVGVVSRKGARILSMICAVRCAIRSVCAQPLTGAFHPSKFWMTISVLALWGGSRAGIFPFSEASCMLMQGACRSPSVLFCLGRAGRQWQTGSAWSGPSAGPSGVARFLNSGPARQMQVRTGPVFDFLMAAPRVRQDRQDQRRGFSARPVPCCPSISLPGSQATDWVFPLSRRPHQQLKMDANLKMQTTCRLPHEYLQRHNNVFSAG